MTSTALRIGVVGLGVMGGRAAAALTAAGHDVVGFDIDPTARERSVAAGVREAASAADVLDGASLVVLSLPGPADTASVAAELAAVRATGSGVLVADLSTIDPFTARQAATGLRGAGHRYVDAPVLGRPAGVGNWTLPTGGAADDVEQLRSIAVGSIAKAVEHVGDVGAGATLKVLNNMMFGVINSVTAEVLDLAERYGLEPARFVEVVADSGAATVSPLFRDVAPRMVSRDHAMVFSLALLNKDLGLGTALARELDAAAEMSTAAEALTAAVVAAGHGASDTSALIELYRQRRGAS